MVLAGLSFQILPKPHASFDSAVSLLFLQPFMFSPSLPYLYFRRLSNVLAGARGLIINHPSWFDSRGSLQLGSLRVWSS